MGKCDPEMKDKMFLFSQFGKCALEFNDLEKKLNKMELQYEHLKSDRDEAYNQYIYYMNEIRKNFVVPFMNKKIKIINKNPVLAGEFNLSDKFVREGPFNLGGMIMTVESENSLSLFLRAQNGIKYIIDIKNLEFELAE